MRFKLQLTLALVLAYVNAAFAQVEYILPQVAEGTFAEGSFRLTFVLVNSSDVPDVATISLTDDSGAPLQVMIPGLGTQSKFVVTLQAGATRLLQTAGTGQLRVGAARVTSTRTIGVSAIFSIYNLAGRFLTEAGVGDSRPGAEFVIPVDTTGNFNTGIAFFNAGSTTANLTIRLLDASGKETQRASDTLQPGQHRARFIAGPGQIFPTGNNIRGTAVVISSSPVAAVVLRQNSAPLSYTSLPAVPRTGGKTQINLPQVANGTFDHGSFGTTFLLFNTSSATANVAVTLTSDDGTPFPVTLIDNGTDSTFNLVLAPDESVFLETNRSRELASGSAVITSTVPIGASAIFSVFDPQERFLTEAGVGDASALTALMLPVCTDASSDTGIAFYNPNDAPVTLTMRLLDASGGTLASTQLALPPRGHRAQFTTQFFQGRTDFRGSMAVTSAEGAVSATILRQNASPLTYTTLPVASGAVGTVPPSGVTSVTISPASASLEVGATYQFTATVGGAGTFDSGVIWSVDGFRGGNSTVGMITDKGFYIAPSILPLPGTLTLTATSVQDPTQSASASVTILATAGGISVRISPQNQQVVFDQSQSVQFAATVTGTDNQKVNWSLSADSSWPGQITDSGSYTPPLGNCGNLSPTMNVVVHAVSAENSGAQAATTVRLIPPKPVITGLSPQSAAAEGSLQISGTIPSGSTRVFFPGPNGITLPVEATAVADQTAVHATVPLGATSGPLYLQVACGGFPTPTSNTVNYLRQPRLRIRADRKDLATGESVQLYAALLGDTTPQPIAWGEGIASTGVYTAPLNTSPDTFVKLSACIQNSTVCDSLIVRINPMVIHPEAPTVPMGGTLRLSAKSGGTDVSPTWSILSGGGSLLADGTYTAPTLLEDGGGVPIAALYGGFTSKASVGVTGGFPGLVNRVADHLDYSTPGPPVGSLASSFAVDSSHAYVLSMDSLEMGAGSITCWIDVYDINDPSHPVWIDAVEALNSEPSNYTCNGRLFTYGGVLYEFVGFSWDGLEGFNEVAAFSLQNNRLALRQVWRVPTVEGANFNQGILYAAPESYNPALNGAPISAYAFDLRSGALIQTNLNLPLPEPGVPSEILGQPVGFGNRLYVLINQPADQPAGYAKIAVYDISASHPSLVGTVDALVGTLTTHWRDLKIFGKNLYDGWDVYDISSGLPIRTGTIPFDIRDVNLRRSLALSGSCPTTILDVSRPGSAKVVGVLDHSFGYSGYPIWVGDFVYEAESTGGWAVSEGAQPGGQLPLARLEDKAVIGTIYDQRIGAPYLYTSEDTELGLFVNIYDLSKDPPALVGYYSESGRHPLSLEVLQNFLFVGTDEALMVLDVTTPTYPKKVATLPIPTSALAISGDVLYAGTTDNRLVVFNVSSPTTPNQIAQLPLPDFPVNLRTAGTLLIIADNTAGLLTYGIADPSRPILLSQYKPSSAIVDVAVDGDLALLAAAEGGLVIVDLKYPVTPALVSQMRLDTLNCLLCPSAAALSVGINGGIVYVGSVNTMYGKVFGFDYRSPAHPRLVSMMSYGSALDQAVLNFEFYQSQMFVGGSLFVVPARRSDITQPRNVINLYYPWFPGGGGSLDVRPVSDVALPTHPKIGGTLRK